MNEFSAALQAARKEAGPGVAVTVQKCFYEEHEDVAKRSEEEATEFREENEIVVSGHGIPKPIETFEEAGWPEYIFDLLKDSEFQLPTPVQCQAWPVLLTGRDCMAVAQAGAGTTLGYLLPCIVHINGQAIVKPGEGPIGLVLTSSREMVNNIHELVKAYCRSSRIKTACLFGGVPRAPQQMELAKGVELVVATPGRLDDMLEARCTNLRRTSFLVMDEVDRMVDMGFEGYLRKFLTGVPRRNRQTVMVSATWPRDVQRLSKEFLATDNIFIKVAKLGCEMVQQRIILSAENEKQPVLLEVLETVHKADSSECHRTLIFVETKSLCDRLTDILRTRGFKALSLHGDKAQEERLWTVNQFTTGDHPIVVTTDVAARVVELNDVEYVINYDFPPEMAAYMERIQRASPAKGKGHAITFFAPANHRFAPELIQVLEDSNQDVSDEMKALGAAQAAATARNAPSLSAVPPPACLAEQHAAPGPMRHTTDVAPRVHPYVDALEVTDGDPPVEQPPQVDPHFETVLLLRNLVAPGSVDDELQNEVQEECEKYGPVKEVQVFEVTGGTCEPEAAVRVFVKCRQREVMYKALVAMSGRSFGGRVVLADVYDHRRYAALDLAPSPLDPPLPRVVMLRNMVAKGAADEELPDEVAQECWKYGDVKDVKVREVPIGVRPEESVRVFVEFEDTAPALAALLDLNGRLFNGRLIHACLYDTGRFMQKDLDPKDYWEPVMPAKHFATICINNEE